MSHNYSLSEGTEKSFIKHRNRKCKLSATNVETTFCPTGLYYSVLFFSYKVDKHDDKSQQQQHKKKNIKTVGVTEQLSLPRNYLLSEFSL